MYTLLLAAAILWRVLYQATTVTTWPTGRAKHLLLVNRLCYGWSEIRDVISEIDPVIFGRQVADVRDDTSDSGHIGCQVHPGEVFGPMKIVVREALLQPLASRN